VVGILIIRIAFVSSRGFVSGEQAPRTSTNATQRMTKTTVVPCLKYFFIINLLINHNTKNNETMQVNSGKKNTGLDENTSMGYYIFP
jgi:hypothetical protein